MKKVLVRRRGRDRSQQVRRAVQLAFLALNVWIGVQFYLFVRYYETNGATYPASRPSGIEGWLPIASLMNLKYLLVTGEMPPHSRRGPLSAAGLSPHLAAGPKVIL